MKLAGKLRWEFEKENKKVRKRITKNQFYFQPLLFSLSLSWSKSCFLVFLLSRVFYKFPPLIYRCRGSRHA